MILGSFPSLPGSFVQRMDADGCYPSDKSLCSLFSQYLNPLDSDFSSGQRYLPFRQLGL